MAEAPRIRTSRQSAERMRVVSEAIASGWPTTEPNVAAFWDMSEASGAIVDEVSAISLAVTGTPTFSVAAGDPYAAITPGITYVNTAFHKKGSAEATLDLGLSDVTIEIWFKIVGGNNTMGMLSCQLVAGTGMGYSVYLSGGANTFRADMCDGAGHNVAGTFNFTGGVWDDGNIHKLRVVWDRDVTVKCFCDGVLQGTPVAAGGVRDYSITAPDVKIGTDPADGTEFTGTIYEVRISKNSTNNSGGPGGG